MKKPANRKNLIIWAMVAMAVLVVSGWLAYYLTHKTSSQTTANYIPPVSSDKNGSAGQTGGVVDANKNKTTSSTSPTSSPTVNPSGVTTASPGIISLVSPADNGTLDNGTSISGSATGIAKVQYRIKDSVRGVISTGELTVSNNKFSGVLAGFNPSSASGTLEIYDYNISGAEENNVKINVRFK